MENRIACAILVIISNFFTLFYIKNKEHWKPEGKGLSTKPGILYIWGTDLIIDSNLLIEPNFCSQIFTKEVCMFKFINKLLSLFTRETVRSVILDKVFVKKSFHNFIFKHVYRCAPFQFKKSLVVWKKGMFARNWNSIDQLGSLIICKVS